jgi:hypothetical protein
LLLPALVMLGTLKRLHAPRDTKINAHNEMVAIFDLKSVFFIFPPEVSKLTYRAQPPPACLQNNRFEKNYLVMHLAPVNTTYWAFYLISTTTDSGSLEGSA